MTPKEKAVELLKNMSKQTYSYQPYAGASYITQEIGDEAGKKCAIIAAKEICYSYKGNELTPEFEYYMNVIVELNKISV